LLMVPISFQHLTMEMWFITHGQKPSNSFHEST
jgi:hypothetical protein